MGWASLSSIDQIDWISPTELSKSNLDYRISTVSQRGLTSQAWIVVYCSNISLYGTGAIDSFSRGGGGGGRGVVAPPYKHNQILDGEAQRKEPKKICGPSMCPITCCFEKDMSMLYAFIKDKAKLCHRQNNVICNCNSPKSEEIIFGSDQYGNIYPQEVEDHHLSELKRARNKRPFIHRDDI
ncbi:hypothetical protein ACFE04_031397 [Oxalis oulophora]